MSLQQKLRTMPELFTVSSDWSSCRPVRFGPRKRTSVDVSAEVIAMMVPFAPIYIAEPTTARSMTFYLYLRAVRRDFGRGSESS
jgi:hypothetical protein